MIDTSDGSVLYEAEYWPNGEVQTETGTNPTSLGFVGLLGYFRDLPSLLYVRARHYLTQKARWLSVDPLWPQEASYEYVMGTPVGVADPSGLQVIGYPPVIIGPPGLNVGPCYPGASPGVTDCQLAQGYPGFGKPYTKICAVGFDFTCTEIHEEVHRNQMSDCCAKAAECVKRSKDGGKQCQKKFDDWLAKNEPAFECAAYTVSCRCFQSFERGAGTVPGPLGTSCSLGFAPGRRAYCREATTLCSKAPKISPCPF